MRKKKSGTVLGVVILVLLTAAVVIGGVLVWRAAGAKEAAPEPQPVMQAPAAEQPVQETLPEPTPVRQVEAQVERTPEPTPEQTPVRQEAQTLTLMALGDNLIHNCVYWSAELPEGGYDFLPFYREIEKTVQSYDLACINQETIYVKDAWNVSNYPDFGSPTQVGDALVQAGFDVVSCATNHCFDKGMTGLNDTLSFWKENYPAVTLLGIHDTQEDAQSVKVVEKNGIRLAMLNYTYGMNSGRPAEHWRVDEFSTYDRVRGDLQKAEAAADLTVVFAHWGEEGQYQPNSYQKTWAQFLADNGADVIIGAHPHVLQPLETVTAADGREVPVFYSLGNFLHHQTDYRQMLGGMASVTFTKDEAGVRVSAYELKPTVNVIFRSGDWYDYCPMLLDDYTDEIAAQHRFEECTVEEMKKLFLEIIGKD